jgi:hypothetical protein
VSEGPTITTCHSYTLESSTNPALNPSTGCLASSISYISTTHEQKEWASYPSAVCAVAFLHIHLWSSFVFACLDCCARTGYLGLAFGLFSMTNNLGYKISPAFQMTVFRPSCDLLCLVVAFAVREVTLVRLAGGNLLEKCSVLVCELALGYVPHSCTLRSIFIPLQSCTKRPCTTQKQRFTSQQRNKR